jgi:hypothetical protein
MKRIMKKVKIAVSAAVPAGLTGCYDTNTHGNIWNGFITGIAILAAAVLVFFIVLGIASAFYKGKDVKVKVLKKHEAKVLRGGMMGRSSPGYKGQTDLSRRARRQKGRLKFSKVSVELDGKEKLLRCNDNVILDKLLIGKVNHIRIRFGEVIKILK